MTVDEFVPQVLPGSMRSLASGVPPAPPGAIFALAADGGFAVPPRKFTLHFGRGKGDVHVLIGVNDPYVSRLHGALVYDGRESAKSNSVRLACQALEGLAHAHAQSVVHRDLTPHNILLGEADGSIVAKAGDFGLAKAFDQAGLSGLTRTGATAGKYRFGGASRASPRHLPR